MSLVLKINYPPPISSNSPSSNSPLPTIPTPPVITPSISIQDKRVIVSDRSKPGFYSTSEWAYLPSLFSPLYFEPLLTEIEHLCVGLEMQVYDRTVVTRRQSCTFSSDERTSVYGHSSYPWEASPTISALKVCVEDITKLKFDYVLAHHYVDGRASINWHRDKEAENRHVFSLSFGETRRFLFRKMNYKEYSKSNKDFDFELSLHSGDAVWMFAPNGNPLQSTGQKGNQPQSNQQQSHEITRGCQNVYLHCVPIETKVKGSRINLTFRQY